ncbi:MAG: erythromycin esterase family protein [Vulcanimicrobiaceae bacterium]
MESRMIVPLQGGIRDYDGLLHTIGEAQFVLIGEATHGTHEFYRMRAEITQRLIAERDFMAVCIEGDWPDAYRVNRYVRGAADDAEAVEALGEFKRFPTWMWRNAEVLDFVSWLREFNDRVPAGERKTGFYGLDLYSMYASIDAVIHYLEKVDPQAAQRAKQRYACLESFQAETGAYAYALLAGLQPSCRQQVIDELLEIQRRASTYAKLDGRVAEDEYFYAEQNARIVANAEEYYGTMLDEDVSSWNLRDRHMVETLENLARHLGRYVGKCKMVVWAHNSHVGDANATAMSQRGETNIGALMRERYGNDAVLVGFTTYTGTVTAASDWHAPEERKRVRPARPDSYEHLFHNFESPQFYVPLRNHRQRIKELPERLLERAIGVVYRPETELASHYFKADVLHQFDALFHIDTTRAVEPLERTALWEAGEAPETYPTGV